MKRLLFAFITFLLAPSADLLAQAYTVSADHMKIVYVGLYNPLTIVSVNCNCNDISATVDVGEIKKVEGCRYRYEGSKEGKAIITVFQNTEHGKKVIGTQVLEVRLLNPPKAIVGSREGLLYPLAEFKVQKGITVVYENYEGELRAIVRSFTFKILRNGVLTYNVEMRGPSFDGECREAMAALKPGDKVIIEKITIVGPEVCPRRLNDLTYTMK